VMAPVPHLRRVALRACLVSDRVSSYGANLASSTRITGTLRAALRLSSLNFRSVSSKESYRDRSSTYNTPTDDWPKHLHQPKAAH